MGIPSGHDCPTFWHFQISQTRSCFIGRRFLSSAQTVDPHVAIWDHARHFNPNGFDSAKRMCWVGFLSGSIGHGVHHFVELCIQSLVPGTLGLYYHASIVIRRGCHLCVGLPFDLGAHRLGRVLISSICRCLLDLSIESSWSIETQRSHFVLHVGGLHTNANLKYGCVAEQSDLLHRQAWDGTIGFDLDHSFRLASFGNHSRPFGTLGSIGRDLGRGVCASSPSSFHLLYQHGCHCEGAFGNPNWLPIPL
eukprot:scaffold6679_cov144-Amphora_coffeaeformis.AAC.4